MRKLIFFFLIPLLACNVDKTAPGENLITVSIRPQKYIVEQIAGNQFRINVLVPDGSSPETYEPSASQMRGISESKLCIINGLLDFEKGWMPKVAEMHPELKIINTSEQIELIAGHDHHHHSAENGDHEEEHEAEVNKYEPDYGTHLHGGIDPHTWLSLRTVKSQAKSIFESLVAISPSDSALFRSNYINFMARLDSADAVIIEAYKNINVPAAFMIYHPSLSYYAQDYKVKQIPIELEGKEPSPAYMKELIDVASKENISTIFYSAQFDKRSAETIANQLGITLTTFDPLEEDIIKNLLKVTEQIINTTKK